MVDMNPEPNDARALLHAALSEVRQRWLKERLALTTQERILTIAKNAKLKATKYNQKANEQIASQATNAAAQHLFNMEACEVEAQAIEEALAALPADDDASE